MLIFDHVPYSDSKGYIDEDDIKMVCNQLSIYCPTNSAKCMLMEYDTYANNIISYSEFLKFVTPVTLSTYQPKRRVPPVNYSSVHCLGGLTASLTDRLTTLLNCEIQYQMLVTSIRDSLANDGGWSITAGFDDMNTSLPTGYITTSEIYSYCSTYAFVNLSNDKLTCILNRYDRDTDGQINSQEFTWAVHGFQPVNCPPPYHIGKFKNIMGLP